MPLASGSLPSSVYRISLTPEPGPSSADSVTSAALVVQPPGQGPPSQAIVVVGAVASAVTVKGVAAESRPAPLRATTSFGSAGSAADAANVYAWAYGALASLPPPVQFAPSAGKATCCTPEPPSAVVAVTVKPPVAPGRKKTVEPVALAFVNEPKERFGELGAVVSIRTSSEPVSRLPTWSSAAQRTVAVAATSKAPVYGVPPTGSLPSSVYRSDARPEPPSLAARVTLTGEDVYQPAEQAAPSHAIELVGAVVSCTSVKEPLLVRPAPLCAVTVCAPLAVDEDVQAYEPWKAGEVSSPPPVIPASAGNATLSTPDSASDAVASTVKVPLLAPLGL